MTRLDLTDVTIVISVKPESDERLANLARLHEYYRTMAKGAEVLVVEQSTCSRIEPRPGLSVHGVADDGLHWKTRNMNLGAALSSRRNLLMSDCDTVPHPVALEKGLAFLAEHGGFTSLYDGIVVNVTDERAAGITDWPSFFEGAAHYSSVDVRPGQPLTDPGLHPLYGNAEHDAVGGCFLCTRAAFFAIGGWNPNFVSYGYEDRELHFRARRLGYGFPMTAGHNLYHFDHPRGPESRYGQFYRLNEAEYDRVRAMTPEALAAYAARGFRQIGFEPGYDYARFSSADADGWHRVPDTKSDLSDLAILILADPSDVCRAKSCLEPLLDHLEDNFRGYDLRICENRTTAYKYPVNRKNVVFCCTQDGPSAGELRRIAQEAGKPSVFALRLTTDNKRQFAAVCDLFSRVADGEAVRVVFPSAETAIADVL